MKRFTLQLICLAALAVPVYADTAAIRPLASQPTAVLCPTASALQAQVLDVAPKCVATTVGLVVKVGDPNMMSIASGSGVLVSAEGLILTAGHVIEKPGNPLTIRFANGKVVQGVAIGLDHATDTGLARITDTAPEGGWAFATIAPDDSAKLGEWVLATGNPGSIVLDRNPPLRIGRVTGHDAKNLKTNCALEPGDSGGPVFDLEGRVVGINSRIFTSSAAVQPKEYLSMHVPVSLFSTEWKDLMAGENANPNVHLGRSRPPRQLNTAAAKFRAAINKLIAQKDPEVLKMLTDAQASGHAPAMTPELMDHFIQKAGLSTTQPTTGKSEVAEAPATPPATAPAQKGVASEFRPLLRAQLRRSLLLQFPDARISDDLLNRIMDRSSFDPATKKLNIVPDPQDLKDMGLSPEAIAARAANAMASNRAADEVGKTSLQTLALFSPALDAAGDCVVEIRSDDKPVLLGTIVSADGYIVTKASDLPDRPTVVLSDGRKIFARLIGKDTATDIALLKVRATGLTPVNFSDASPLGTFLAAPTGDPNQPAVGVVSDAARPIPEKFAHFAGEQKLVLGVGFGPESLVVVQVTPGMPAEAAGLKIGDEVFELNGKPVQDPTDFMARMKKTKSGETLSIKVHRDKGDLELKPVLGKVKSTTQTTNGVGEADSYAGGKLSKRRTNFPLAIQTDAAIWADQCGGPLVNLQGQTLGVTIARYDRVCTFAIPAELVEKTVEKLKKPQE